MPKLPKRKAGIVACAGEELPEGTITRLAALKVLERLRPADTVTICLPLFLAGGEGDRTFARFYPTIAIDGCEKRCAARATEKYSGRPARSVQVREIIAGQGLGRPEGLRRLNPVGLAAVEATAAVVAGLVDEVLKKPGGAAGKGKLGRSHEELQPPVQATCSCGSGIPVVWLEIGGKKVELVALPLILEQFRSGGCTSDAALSRKLLETVRIYNEVPVGAEEAYAAALLREYEHFCSGKKKA